MLLEMQKADAVAVLKAKKEAELNRDHRSEDQKQCDDISAQLKGLGSQIRDAQLENDEFQKTSLLGTISPRW